MIIVDTGKKVSKREKSAALGILIERNSSNICIKYYSSV